MYSTAPSAPDGTAHDSRHALEIAPQIGSVACWPADADAAVCNAYPLSQTRRAARGRKAGGILEGGRRDDPEGRVCPGDRRAGRELFPAGGDLAAAPWRRVDGAVAHAGRPGRNADGLYHQ